MTLIKYKLKKLPHEYIIVIEKLLNYRIDVLEKQALEADKKMHLTIASRFYRKTIRKKAESHDPPKTTTLKMDFDEAYCLFWAFLIYQDTHLITPYENAIVDQMKTNLYKQLL